MKFSIEFEGASTFTQELEFDTLQEAVDYAQDEVNNGNWSTGCEPERAYVNTLDEDGDYEDSDSVVVEKQREMVIIRINDIPFSEQLFSRSILKYADDDDFHASRLTESQLRDFETYIQVSGDLTAFREELSCKLAEYVGEKYGKELGEAFRGLPDNGDGIWFEDMDVDYDMFDEIRTECEALADDVDWLNDNLPEYTIEYEFS